MTKQPMSSRRVVVEAAVGILAIAMFAISCITERPYMVAFWGVFLICDSIREAGR